MMRPCRRWAATRAERCSSEAGSEAQEERLSALVAGQRLHGRIIDELHGTPESALKVKAYPTRSQVMRFGNGPAPENWPGVANRYHVILPIADHLFNSGNHLVRRHCRSGRKRPVCALPGGEDLDVCAAHIHN